MIKHIVMYRLKDFAEGAGKAENASKMKSLLEGLKGKIAEIKHIEVGINIDPSGSGYDVALYSEFDDEKGLGIYQQHPEHKKVKEFVGKVREGRVGIDYKI